MSLLIRRGTRCRGVHLLAVAAVGIAMLATPALAEAQFGLVETAVGPLEQLVEGLMNLKEQCIDASREAAGTVFIGLATVHLLWVAQQTLLRGGDLSGGLGAFVEQLIIVSLFAVIVREGPAWGQDIVDFLRGVGHRVSGSPYVPQTLFDLSVELFIKNAGILNFGPNLMYAASMALSCTIAAIMFIAQLEATIVLSIGSIVLGFGGSVWTRSLATRYFQMALSSGLRLMLLEVLQGMSMRHLGDAMKIALQGGTKALEATVTLVGAELFTVLLMLVLPLVFHALSSGTISTGVESMLARVPMMLAGGGVASAVMSSMQARQAVSSITSTGTGSVGAAAGTGSSGATRGTASATDFMSQASGGRRRSGGGGPIPRSTDLGVQSVIEDVGGPIRPERSSRATPRPSSSKSAETSRAGAAAPASTGLPATWRGATADKGQRRAAAGEGSPGSRTENHHEAEDSDHRSGPMSPSGLYAGDTDSAPCQSPSTVPSHSSASSFQPASGLRAASAAFPTEPSAPATGAGSASAKDSTSAGASSGAGAAPPRWRGSAAKSASEPSTAATHAGQAVSSESATDAALARGGPSGAPPRAAHSHSGGGGRAGGVEAGPPTVAAYGAPLDGGPARRPPAREVVAARKRVGADKLSASAALSATPDEKGSV